jgi:hypothetical protein
VVLCTSLWLLSTVAWCLGFLLRGVHLLGLVPWAFPSVSAAALVSPKPPAVQARTWAAELVFWDRTSCSLSWSSHVDNLRVVSCPLPHFIYCLILCNLLVLNTWVSLHYCGWICMLDDDSGVVTSETT